MLTQTNWHSELHNRRKKLWAIIQKADCEICLICSSREHPESFRYLTNFVPTLGDMWGVQTGPGDITCVLNFNWELNEAKQVSGLSDWHGYFDPMPFLFEVISALKPARMAVLGLQRMPWLLHDWLIEKQKVDLVPLDAELEQMRRVKSPIEIKLLREAVRVTDLAFSDVQPLIRQGVLELDLIASILHTFHKNGCEPSFFPVVIGGVDPDSAVIARKPRQRLLETGDTLMLDIGAAYQGYQADVSRTYFIGKMTQTQRNVWDVVHWAYDAVIELCKPGTPCNRLHQTAQAIVEEAGYSLGHRVGHGFGLSTSFEWPSLDVVEEELKPGYTIAVEPAVYTVGAGAIKREDCILITENGCEVLSQSPVFLS